MMEHAQAVLHTILKFKFQASELLVVRKPMVKLIQRIGQWMSSPYKRFDGLIILYLISKKKV